MDKCRYFRVQKQICDFVLQFCFVHLSLPFSLLHLEKGLCDPIFLFVKTVGPKVFRGNFGCAGEQNYRSRLGVGFLQSNLSVPPNLAASLDARRRSDVMTVLKKERRYSYLYQPSSEI